jgi:hypothetical protein
MLELTSENMKITPEKRRMIRIIKRFQKLVATYPVENNSFQSDRCFVLDVIYMAGVAIGPKKFAFANGFMKFKKIVLDHMAEK